MSRLISRLAWLIYAAALVAILLLVFNYGVTESARVASDRQELANTKKELSRCLGSKASSDGYTGPARMRDRPYDPTLP
jgi:hypothetical protein